jgi:hypothetical protein
MTPSILTTNSRLTRPIKLPFSRSISSNPTIHPRPTIARSSWLLPPDPPSSSSPSNEELANQVLLLQERLTDLEDTLRYLVIDKQQQKQQHKKKNEEKQGSSITVLSTTTTDEDEHQQDDDVAEQQDDNEKQDKEEDQLPNVDDMLHSFTEVMSQGYLASVTKLREKLMEQEWDGNRKLHAMRYGVALFEAECYKMSNNTNNTTNGINIIPNVITYTELGALYQDPSIENLEEVVRDERLRALGRTLISQATDEAEIKVYDACTKEARNLASRFSSEAVLKEILPDTTLMDGLKTLIPAAVKLLV